MGANYYFKKPSCITLGREYWPGEDKHKVFLHVCRTTNNLVILNIHPIAMMFYHHETACVLCYEDGSVMPFDELWKKIWSKGTEFDTEYIGTRVRFS